MPSDDVPALTRKQLLVLAVLSSEARELSNNELTTLTGSSLTGSDNVRLETELGLVETDRSHRPFSHKLTPKGWEVARKLPTEPQEDPKPVDRIYADDIPSLTPNQILALIVLMSEARELNNNELKELGGFSLTGADNTKLEKKLGLVETDRTHRPYSHQLTEQGWGLVRRLHTMKPPTEAKSATRTLLTLLGNISRSLEQLQSTHGVKLSHGEFFRPQPLPAESGAAEVGDAEVGDVEVGDVEGGDAESRVRKAYASLVGRPGDWVGLADLRDQLPGLARAEVDAALMALLDQDGVRIIPVANTKALSARDRAAAIDIGGEASHALAIGQP
ncbi:hypothetical protein [Dactylosporangium sp. NPDC051484]|uniref:hypothetical protein n=1 Tax=Dactylosporangium sp. NPDC051484 TaxID=3154942 RepID=UPI00344B24D4